MERRMVALVAAGGALAILAAGCAAEPEPAPTGSVVLLDADAHGAVVLDGGSRTARGVLRQGEVVWESTLDSESAVPVSCVDACPDAVLSGSPASVNDPSVPDPVPVLIQGGARHPLAVPSGAAGQRRVVEAAHAHDLVMSTVDHSGVPWLEVHHGDAVERIPVGGSHTSWSSSADGLHALAVTAVTAATAEARWFDRAPSGWRTTPGSLPVTGGSSCVAPDGGRAMVLGEAPAIRDRSGGRQAVTDLDAVGTCAFAGTGAILAALRLDSGGAGARVRVIDASGRVTWSGELRHEVRVCADPTGGRVAYVGGGSLHEFDPSTGVETRVIPHVRAARYDGAGDLVVVGADRRVAWLD